MIATPPSCHVHTYLCTCVCTFVQLNVKQSFVVVNIASLYMYVYVATAILHNSTYIHVCLYIYTSLFTQLQDPYHQYLETGIIYKVPLYATLLVKVI